MKMAKAIVMALLMSALASRMNAQEIFDAVRNGDLAKVKELIEKDPKLVNAKNSLSATPLHIAAEVDHAEIAKYLIEKGADVHALNSYLLTPLNDSGLQVARILVENGADVNLIAINGGGHRSLQTWSLGAKKPPSTCWTRERNCTGQNLVESTLSLCLHYGSAA
ncbi:MAG: ankyrin repeat domain-containing protein [Candidatus Aminicenantes bacterium]|nr:ankyrin repeat domain-containing protein [Candidatus Aminicenantes bacterium]